MGKYLAGSIGSAPYGTACLLAVRPYEKGAAGRYGNIQFWDQDVRPCCMSCRTEIISRALADELGQWYLPGGINIEYIQQQDGDWLVCFKANNIIASAYMRLSADEMYKLLKGMGEQT